jgi:fumarate reductase flavoprotein subunit
VAPGVEGARLTNLVAVSRAIVRAGVARENSRGAHFRPDFPEPGELSASTFIRVQEHGGALEVEAVPVRFTRVQPGASLLAS